VIKGYKDAKKIDSIAPEVMAELNNDDREGIMFSAAETLQQCGITEWV
jgi:hypothetical protein